MICEKCEMRMTKNGFIKSNGKQRFSCTCCGVSRIEKYDNKACQIGISDSIVLLLKEGCGTLSIARLLQISPTTVTKRILQIASMIKKPIVAFGKEYEMDELITFVGSKKNRICIAYAIDRTTKQVIDFVVGKRNKTNLGKVVNTLLLSAAKVIRTDKLNHYLGLIPKHLHIVKQRGTNYIERKNLTLRTHIKRLNRRSIAYSKSQLVLQAILTIYFWF